jgi:hypothetical protein
VRLHPLIDLLSVETPLGIGHQSGGLAVLGHVLTRDPDRFDVACRIINDQSFVVSIHTHTVGKRLVAIR